jgi:tRNA-dihydrouridine synthase A
VMLGRAVYHDPWLLADVDERFFGEAPRSAMRHDVLEAWLPQVQRELDAGVPLARMTRHVLGLFNGLPGARAWRRYLSENAHRPGAGVEVVRVAASRVGAQNLIKNVS